MKILVNWKRPQPVLRAFYSDTDHKLDQSLRIAK